MVQVCMIDQSSFGATALNYATSIPTIAAQTHTTSSSVRGSSSACSQPSGDSEDSVPWPRKEFGSMMMINMISHSIKLPFQFARTYNHIPQIPIVKQIMIILEKMLTPNIRVLACLMSYGSLLGTREVDLALFGDARFDDDLEDCLLKGA